MVETTDTTKTLKIILGPRLKGAMERELEWIIKEWNCAGKERRGEMKRQITIIRTLLDVEDRP